MNTIKLFCLPYAGGSSAIFSKWKQYLNPEIELRPIELAGRGKRINERLYKDAWEVIDDVFYTIKKDLISGPYAFYGHSMGSMIAYGLAQKIRENELPQPLHLFFSGRSAPHVVRADAKKYHLMNDEEFKKEVIALGGTPTEFFEHPALMDLFLPVLRNDFRISESGLFQDAINPFDCNITVFLGKEEDLTPEQCEGWKKHSQKICTIHYINGGHFFLNDETEHLVTLINVALTGNIHTESLKRLNAFKSESYSRYSISESNH